MIVAEQLGFAVGVLPTRKVYPADVTLALPERKPTGRPREHPVASTPSAGAAELLESRPAAFRTVSWRAGTKGSLEAEFAALRVRVADAPLEALAVLIKARWVCEQVHQQLKDELGLDHFEGRSWRGLHHHALLCLLAFAFLQHLRLGGRKRRDTGRARPAARAEPAGRAPADRGGTHPCAP